MLLRLNYTCDKCGYKYNHIHHINSDKIKNRLLSLKHKCPQCKAVMYMSKGEEFTNPFEIKNSDEIFFMNEPLVKLADGRVSINAGNLLYTGYAGILDIFLDRKRIALEIDPVKRQIEVVE